MSILGDSKKVFEPYPEPKNSLVGPKRVQKDPKIKSKSNVWIKGNKENESCSTTWLDFKTVYEPFPNTKYSPLGSQNVKKDPKIKSKSNNRIAALDE